MHYQDDDQLRPCAHCGGFGEFSQDESGGHFIQCTNSMCGMSTCVVFATGDDPMPILMEKWNRRVSPQEQEDYRRMFGGALNSLAQISHALGIDEESAACANGNELILEAIARKNEAILAALQRRDDEESDSQFTPGHADFERRQIFVAPRVGSWPWLRGCVNGIPKREEFISGQRIRYVALDEVLGWIDEGERRTNVRFDSNYRN